MPPRISYASNCQGSSHHLRALDSSRRHQQARIANPSDVSNVQALENGMIRRPVTRMTGRQFGTALLFATALATLPRGAVAAPRQKGATFSPLDTGLSVDQSTIVTHAKPAMPMVAYRGPVSDQPLAARGGGRRPQRDPVPGAGNGASRHAVRPNAEVREGIKRSFVEDGSNLGDRVAEGIVARLPGWPADRPLWIVRSRADGGHETIRTYPDVQPTGKPVTLLLENNVYIALAEQGSGFGEGERLTEPEGDVQRGNSFYLALQRALFPGQRHAMGLSPADTDDVSLLRDKVAVFSHATANRHLMNRLFGECEQIACWLDTHQRAPAITSSTPTANALTCAFSEFEKTIGPVNARARFVFNIYVHNDVTWTTDRILAERLDWWLQEMSGLLPAGAGLRLRIVRGAPGIADLNYVARPTDDRGGGDSPNKGYHAIRNAVGRGVPCAAEADMPREYHLLLTQRPPYATAKESILGLALDYVAIACLEGRNTVGHELGHLMGARHGDAKSLSIGPWRYCVTAMREWDSKRQHAGMCLHYSDENRANVRATLQARMPKAPDLTDVPGGREGRVGGRRS